MVQLKRMDLDLIVCRLGSGEHIPSWALQGKFVSVTRTEEELSIICESRKLPPGKRASVKYEADWRPIKVQGPIGFEMVGVIAGISQTLTARGITLFAVSTYDTDYILVKRDKFDDAVESLVTEGYPFVE